MRMPIRPARTALPLTAAALLLALAGCSGKREPTAPTTPPPPARNAYIEVLSAHMPHGFVVPNTVDTTATLLFTGSVDGGAPFAGGVFRNGAGWVDAGAVFVRKSLSNAVADSVGLDTESFSYGGAPRVLYTSTLSHPFNLDLTFNGSTRHIFGVAGSGAFPAAIDSVISVTMPLLTQPILHDFYPRAQDLTVSWSNPGADTTVYVTATITSVDDPTKEVQTAVARDLDGQLVIPAAVLQPLFGHVEVALSRYRLGYRTTAGRRVGVMCSAVATRLFYLN